MPDIVARTPHQEPIPVGQCDCSGVEPVGQCDCSGVEPVGQCDCSGVEPVGQCDCSVVSDAPGILAAWLHITDRCNLRCAYCYLPHLPNDMAPEVARAAVDATLRSATTNGYRQIRLKYAGGEPLLRAPLVIETHRYARHAAEEAGLVLDGLVLSNGTLLTPEIVHDLRAVGLHLVVSLDGLGDGHDCQRTHPGGAGSVAAVTAAVDMALAHGLVPSISITVSGRNINHLPTLLGWVLDRDLPFGINFYRQHNQRSQPDDLQIEEAQIIAGMLAAYRVILARLPRRSLMTALVDRANFTVAHHYTCGACHSYLVFDPAGRIAKCQMQMQQPVATTSDPDPLQVVRADEAGLQNPSVDTKEGCITCRWRYWCAGGCPLETYHATGRYDLRSPHCAIYQALYPEVLRLEALRIQKYGR